MNGPGQWTGRMFEGRILAEHRMLLVDQLHNVTQAMIVVPHLPLCDTCKFGLDS